MTELIKNEPGPNEILNELFYFKVEEADFVLIKNQKGKVYKLTREGKIYNGDKEINTHESRRGPWMRVSFVNGKKRLVVQVHRLMLECFRPIANSVAYQVNHIDGDGSNNRLDNLEWVTQTQNIQHARHRKDPNVDVRKPVGIIAHNVLTDETIEFIDRREVCIHFGISRDKLRYIIKKLPFGFIDANGWRFKRRQDKREFKEPTQAEIAKMGKGHARPITLYRVNDGKEYNFPSLSEASTFSGISPAALSQHLNFQKRLEPFSSKRGGEVWEVQYTMKKQPWLEYETIWHALNDTLKFSKPVVIELENGSIQVFENSRELAKEYSLAPSTVSFRLKTIEGKKHHNDGLTIWDFFNWYNLNKEKYTKEQINSGFIPGNKF